MDRQMAERTAGEVRVARKQELVPERRILESGVRHTTVYGNNDQVRTC